MFGIFVLLNVLNSAEEISTASYPPLQNRMLLDWGLFSSRSHTRFSWLLSPAMVARIGTFELPLLEWRSCKFYLLSIFIFIYFKITIGRIFIEQYVIFSYFMQLILTSISGLILLCCCRKKYPGMKGGCCVFIVRVQYIVSTCPTSY